MKGLAIGDFFVPASIMVQAFDSVSDIVTEVISTEWKSESREDIRRKIRNIEKYGPYAEDPPEGLDRLLEDVDILTIHNCPINSEMIRTAKKLKVIGAVRGGVENIDVVEATEKGIVIIRTPHHNSHATAEYAVSLMLAETRNIARSHLALKNGQWREYYPNTEHIPELNGSTVGLVGFGHVARLVAKKLSGFEVKILVYDPYVPHPAIAEAGCTPVELETLLRASDIVSLHVRLSPETEGLIGDKELRMMKPSAYLINTARAGLLDMEALQTALEEKWINGAGIDVFEIEPIPENYPLLTLDNVTVTNHRAGDTRNSYWNAPALLGKQLSQVLRGGTSNYVVNPEALPVIALKF